MCLRRCFGFLLLVWLTGVLHAQSPALSCSAPTLNGGFWVPEQEVYSHETKLTYACENGLKPAVEGWWATSTCQNGAWSHEPQCIDEMACFPPDIPNAEHKGTEHGWYTNGHKIRITCVEGYETINRDTTAVCTNGTWSSVPVCQKNIYACGEPLQVPHAVIILQGYQDLFATNSRLQYECEDGYTIDGVETKTMIYCIAGNWTDGPTCIRGTGQGGSTVGGAGGRDTGSTEGGGVSVPLSGSRPGTGHGGSTVGGTGGRDTTSTESGGSRPGTGHGGSTVGGTSSVTRPQGGGTGHGGTQPAGGGSTTPGSNDRDSRPLLTSVRDCGPPPTIPNGVLVQEETMYLKYKCNAFYTHAGLDTLMCYNNGRWSELPICREAYCVLNPTLYRDLRHDISGVQYIKEGEIKHFSCMWNYYSRLAGCVNGRLILTSCCHYSDHNRGVCN